MSVDFPHFAHFPQPKGTKSGARLGGSTLRVVAADKRKDHEELCN